MFAYNCFYNFSLEIRMPIGKHLVAPNLRPGQKLNGKTLKSIFSQKIIYVVASQYLFDVSFTFGLQHSLLFPFASR